MASSSNLLELKTTVIEPFPRHNPISNPKLLCISRHPPMPLIFHRRALGFPRSLSSSEDSSFLLVISSTEETSSYRWPKVPLSITERSLTTILDKLAQEEPQALPQKVPLRTFPTSPPTFLPTLDLRTSLSPELVTLLLLTFLPRTNPLLTTLAGPIFHNRSTLSSAPQSLEAILMKLALEDLTSTVTLRAAQHMTKMTRKTPRITISNSLRN